MTEMETELAALLNRHSAENASNTPDFILAQYLTACLEAFNVATQQRETWRGEGRDAMPSAPPELSAERDRAIATIHSELARACEVVERYRAIGAPGLFAVTWMQATIERAEKALADDDVVAIVRSYAELKEIHA